MMVPVMDIVIALHMFSTFAMCGLIWFVQIVHYPMMARYDRTRFAAIEKEHCDRTGFVVVPPMLLEACTAGLLLLAGEWSLVFLVSTALLGGIWASTFFLQVPDHRRLLMGWNEEAHRRLVEGNWIRTVGWTLRSMAVACVFFE